MCTVRCSGHLGGDVCPVGGVCPGGRTPPSLGQTDTCKNITFPQLLLWTVTINLGFSRQLRDHDMTRYPYDIVVIHIQYYSYTDEYLPTPHLNYWRLFLSKTSLILYLCLSVHGGCTSPCPLGRHHPRQIHTPLGRHPPGQTPPPPPIRRPVHILLECILV